MNENKETISRLKFIGKIQIGEKIDVKNMYLETDSILTQITRTVLQNNRNKTLVFIHDTITKSFEVLRCYQKSKKKSEQLMCSYLIEDLKNSKTGLNNIKKTYERDPKFCCDIDTLLQMIEAKLSEIKIFLPPPPPLHDEDEYNYDAETQYEGDDL